MNSKNDSRFLSSWGPRLAELGLDVWDVNVGRYVQIDLSKPRKEPEEFAEFGEFDTFTVLNPHDIPEGVWLYLNNKRPESRLPLHYVSRLETIADRFYLQHDDGWDGLVLHVILGGDLRALSVEPSSKGVVSIEGTIDVSDRPERELGKVTAEFTGEVDITDRPTRELGSVSVPGVATELTLGAVRALLESLADKDFATEETLETVRALLEVLEGKDFATETSLSDMKTAVEGITRTLALLTSPPATGKKTITDSPTPLFAKSVPLSGRKQLTVYNDGNETLYIGDIDVDSESGFPIFVGQYVTVHFDPDITTHLYGVTDTGNTTQVRIWESK